jgi:hypothetical protein
MPVTPREIIGWALAIFIVLILILGIVIVWNEIDEEEDRDGAYAAPIVRVL